MGLFSSFRKGVKKIFKGVRKVVKKVFKAVKKFAKSKFGKILLAAAAIYFGGVALGAFGKGAAASQLTASTVVEGAVAGAAEGAAAAGAVGAEATASGLAAAAEASTAAAQAAGGAATVAEGAAAVAPTAWNSIAGKASKIGGWMDKHPVLTKAAGTVLSSAFSKDPETAEDILKARQRASNIAGVDYGGRGEPLTVGLLRRSNQLPAKSEDQTKGATPYG